MKHKVAAVVGPTASGKSDAAIQLCQHIDGEIVSMDAMQIYQGMKVGTARLDPAEWQGVPHHGLAYVPPDTPYTVAEYAKDTLVVIDDILSRGKLPVLVGGTGLYLSAVRRPMSFASTAADHSYRAQLEGLDAAALHQQLARVDPATAKRLHINDRRRVVRALEIAHATGSTMSSAADAIEDRYDMLIMGIQVPRDILLSRINHRAARMIASGLVDEVRFLLRHGLQDSAQAMQAIGYKETALALRDGWRLDRLRGTIEVRTRQYAKRQMTWFKRVPGLQWHDHTNAASEMTAAARAWIDA